MSSAKEYLAFVLEQLSGAEAITYRPMMGEYVLYCRGRVIGGVYDNRLLLKPTKTALRLLEEAGLPARTDIPYPGAKPLLTADVDRPELLCRIAEGIADDLPAPAPKKPRAKKAE